MSRPKGSKNKNSAAVPVYSTFSVEERIVVIANLIVDRILEDQTTNKKILKAIEAANAAV